MAKFEIGDVLSSINPNVGRGFQECNGQPAINPDEKYSQFATESAVYGYGEDVLSFYISSSVAMKRKHVGDYFFTIFRSSILGSSVYASHSPTKIGDCCFPANNSYNVADIEYYNEKYYLCGYYASASVQPCYWISNGKDVFNTTWNKINVGTVTGFKIIAAGVLNNIYFLLNGTATDSCSIYKGTTLVKTYTNRKFGIFLGCNYVFYMRNNIPMVASFSAGYESTSYFTPTLINLSTGEMTTDLGLTSTISNCTGPCIIGDNIYFTLSYNSFRKYSLNDNTLTTLTIPTYGSIRHNIGSYGLFDRYLIILVDKYFYYYDTIDGTVYYYINNNTLAHSSDQIIISKNDGVMVCPPNISSSLKFYTIYLAFENSPATPIITAPVSGVQFYIKVR